MIEPIVRIRIELQENEPKVWRRVDVPPSATLASLHDKIVGDRVYGERHPDEGMDEQGL